MRIRLRGRQARLFGLAGVFQSRPQRVPSPDKDAPVAATLSFAQAAGRCIAMHGSGRAGVCDGARPDSDKPEESLHTSPEWALRT